MLLRYLFIIFCVVLFFFFLYLLNQTGTLTVKRFSLSFNSILKQQEVVFLSYYKKKIDVVEMMRGAKRERRKNSGIGREMSHKNSLDIQYYIFFSVFLFITCAMKIFIFFLFLFFL